VRAELSQEQQKQWSSLKQLEFACFSGPAWAALDEEMQTELELTDSQAAAIDELQKEFCRECERAMQATGQFERPAGVRFWDTPFMIKVREASATFDERRDALLQKILTRQQYDRWIEIEWQRAADRDGPAVFLEQAVVDYLKLSTDSKRQIQAIADETKRQVENEEKERRFYAATKIPRANLGQALTVLTSHQKQLWAALLGKPYHDRKWRLMNSTPAPTSDTRPPE
jgi:hypothetical protein